MASDAEFPSALGIALEMRGVEGESEQCGGISADPEGYPRRNICRSRRVSTQNRLNRRGILGTSRRKANATRRDVDVGSGLIGF